jgi:hypothetical protein
VKGGVMTDIVFSTLHLRTLTTKVDIPMSCIGLDNLRFRIEEAQSVDGIEIVGVSVDGQMTTDFQKFLDQSGATVELPE